MSPEQRCQVTYVSSVGNYSLTRYVYVIKIDVKRQPKALTGINCMYILA